MENKELLDISNEIKELLSIRRNELELDFTEDEHKYRMKDLTGTIRDDYPSVSKVLKLFYDEFPTEEAAFKKSKGDPILKDKLIKEWAEAGLMSTNMGSRVHYLLEIESVKMFNLNKEVRQPIFECDSNQIKVGDYMVRAGTNYLNLMNERGAVLIDTEIVLGDPHLGYVGQPDKVWLMKNKEGDGYGLVITDWKTNKPKNFLETIFTKKMYPPFNDLPSTALGHYYVQLPFYGKLMMKMLQGSKYENINLLGCVVVLLKDDGEYEEYRTPKKVVNTILNMDMKKYLIK
jgi:hypothetical protein